MKFRVDAPLGSLAKWLRLCGFDTSLTPLDPAAPAALPPPSPDIFLVSTRALLARLRRPDILILTATEPQAQLEELIRRLRFTPGEIQPLSRCSHCNDLLISADKNQVQDRVPEYVLQVYDRFYECPRCHRLFWPGSHVRTILDILQERLQHSDTASPEAKNPRG